MKKLFALMVVCAALVVAGCGERTDTAPATPPADTGEAAPADTAPADGTTTEEPATP